MSINQTGDTARNTNTGGGEPRRILRLHQVEGRVGRRRTAIYAAMARTEFPRPVRIGLRAVGWLEDEIEKWIEDRVAARDTGTEKRHGR